MKEPAAHSVTLLRIFQNRINILRKGWWFPDETAAGEAASLANRSSNVGEQFWRWKAVGVHEDKPVAARDARAGVARAPDLIDRFEHHVRAGGAGYFSSTVGRIVVADDDFPRPPGLREHIRRGTNAVQSGWEKPLFIECRNDDGDMHDLIIGRYLFFISSVSSVMRPANPPNSVGAAPL